MLDHTILSGLIQRQMPIVICDIDGVILDNTHRLHYITCPHGSTLDARPDADWVSWFANQHLDPPAAAVRLVQILSQTHSVVFVTARIDKGDHRHLLHSHLERTIQLSMHQTVHMAYKYPLIMRESDPNWDRNKQAGGDPAKSHAEFKREAIQWLRAQGLNPTIGLDDTLNVCLMFKEEGLLSLRVHNHVPDALILR